MPTQPAVAAVPQLPDLRIGDVEREAAAESLSAHFAAGRLDRVELDERLTATYAARTASAILPLFADLPGGAPTAVRRAGLVPPVPSRRGPGPRFAPVWPPAPLLAVLTVLLLVASVGALASGHPPVPLLLAMLLVRASRSRHRHAWGPPA